MDEPALKSYTYITQRAPGLPCQRGQIEAPGIDSAEKELQGKRIPVLAIWPSGRRAANRPPYVPSTREKLIFFQSLETALAAGMALPRTLEIVVKNCANKEFQTALRKVQFEVENGMALSEAFRRSGLFDELTVGLIRAGEESSTLAESCTHAKEILRRNALISGRLLTISMYPSAVVVTGIGSIYVLMTQLLPQILPFFENAKAPLPAPTRILIAISHAVSSNPIPSLLCLAALLYGCIHFKQIYHRATWLHGPLLRLPLIGGFLRMVMQETFCRSFVTLSRALPNFVDSLRLVRDSSTNFAFKGAVARSIVAVSHGDGLGVAMHREQSVFSSLIPQAVSTGEEVGNVSDVLEAISIQLSRDLLEYIERLKELLPPLLTAILAIVVFIVLAAIFVPLFILPTLI